MLKKIAVLMLMLFAVCALAACGDKQTLTNEDGEMLVYTRSTLPDNGFYVHDKKHDTFSPVMTGFSGYDGIPSENMQSTMEERMKTHDGLRRFLWVSDTYYQPMTLIPEVDGEKTELVLWQTSQERMPDSFVLEKYKKLGYTVGTHFTFKDTGTSMFIDTKDPCEDSSAETVIGKASIKDEVLEINTINEDKKLPTQNIDKDVNMLLGLEKDKKYKIGYFKGTIYKEVDMLADTVAFKSQNIIDLDSPYNKTEEGYFVINLPQNMTSGYYYVNDVGMFKYKARNVEKQTQAEETEPSAEETKPSAEETKSESKGAENGDKEKE